MTPMRIRDLRDRPGPAVWILIAWCAFALTDAVRTVGSMHAEGMHHNWLLLFAVETLSWLPWAAGSLLVVRFVDRLRAAPPLLEWGGHIAAALSIGLVNTLWFNLLIERFQPYAPEFTHWRPQWPAAFYDGLLSNFVLYACVLLGYRLIESRARIAARDLELAQLNELLARADLQALRSRIEPHFLFNALNAVAGLIREGRSDAAVDTIVQLSDFLRHTLSEVSRREVPLAEEMDYARRYLSIQQTRFAERLRLDIDVQEGLENVAVPHLILQPLVENAVKHGIAHRKEGGTIHLAASANEDGLNLRIANDGPSLPESRNEGSAGVGLDNVCGRLRALYGDAARFDIRNRSGGGVEVLMRIPLRAIE